MTGTIKTLLTDKRCGFIKSGSKDFFFHETALKNVKYEELGLGQEVTFEDAEGTRGPRAEDVYA